MRLEWGGSPYTEDVGEVLWLSLCAVTQSRLTLCSPMVCRPPSSSPHGIFQSRVREWVDISYSRGASQPNDWTHVFCKSPASRADSLPLMPPGKPPPQKSWSNGLWKLQSIWNKKMIKVSKKKIMAFLMHTGERPDRNRWQRRTYNESPYFRRMI